MEQQTPDHNPFMLMLHPEVVLAAVERSERLGKLNRHLCRPLDRPAPTTTSPRSSAVVIADDEIEDADEGAIES